MTEKRTRLFVKKLMANLGLYEIWLQQNVGDMGIFLAAVKQRLQDNVMQKWNEEINASSRAIFIKTLQVLN